MAEEPGLAGLSLSANSSGVIGSQSSLAEDATGHKTTKRSSSVVPRGTDRASGRRPRSVAGLFTLTHLHGLQHRLLTVPGPHGVEKAAQERIELAGVSEALDLQAPPDAERVPGVFQRELVPPEGGVAVLGFRQALHLRPGGQVNDDFVGMLEGGLELDGRGGAGRAFPATARRGPGPPPAGRSPRAWPGSGTGVLMNTPPLSSRRRPATPPFSHARRPKGQRGVPGAG